MLQCNITRFVAECIINKLKVVGIKGDDREWMFVVARMLKKALSFLIYVASIRKLSEMIRHC